MRRPKTREYEAIGRVIREVKDPTSGVFLNIFPGRKIAKCTSEEEAQKLVAAYNASINK